MSRTIFRKKTAYAKWVYLAAAFGVALLVPGLLGGDGYMAFFGCLGGMWIMVALVIAGAVAAAGKGQVTEMSADSEGITVRAAGLFGPGRSFVMQPSEAANWRWLTQGAHRRLGDRLLMLAFDYKGKTRRMPISTAEIVDLDALSAIVPRDIFDDMIVRNPGRVVHRPAPGAGTGA